MLIFTSLSRAFGGLFSFFGTVFKLSGLLLWDNYLTIVNLVTPKKKLGHVYKEGMPGYKGIWPEWKAPSEGDSRCSCPALNAMANHGILPRDGKNIPFKTLTTTIHDTFNFAESFCYFVPWYAAGFLHRDYNTGTLDLSDLDVHNCIEHDGSLVRHDARVQPDQSIIAHDLIKMLLSHASGSSGETLTEKDLSRVLAKRRVHSQERNRQYTLNTGQRFFGSSNSSTLLCFFSGNVAHLRTFLTEEKLPTGWETNIRTRKGLTIASFNLVVNRVEFGIAGYEKDVKNGKDREGVDDIAFGPDGKVGNVNVNGGGQNPFNG